MLGSHGMQKKIRAYIKTWTGRGYSAGLPDEADLVLESLNKAPSYRAICKAIMKNDVALLSLGNGRQPCAAYNAIKRQEIMLRPRRPSAQLELFP